MTTIVIPKDPGSPGLFPFSATSPDCPENSDKGTLRRNYRKRWSKFKKYPWRNGCENYYPQERWANKNNWYNSSYKCCENENSKYFNGTDYVQRAPWVRDSLSTDSVSNKYADPEWIVRPGNLRPGISDEESCGRVPNTAGWENP